MTVPDRYPTKVFWSDEDEGFIALAPDLPGCSAFGETRLEALDAIEHAIVAWQQAASEAGNPVPEPSRPELESSYSGKLLLRLPKRLHAAAAEAAKQDGVSLNQYVSVALASYVARSTIGSAIFLRCQDGPAQVIASSLHALGQSFFPPLVEMTGRASTGQTFIAYEQKEAAHG